MLKTNSPLRYNDLKMSDESIIHVRVESPTQEELREVRDLMENVLADYGGNRKIVVSDNRMSLGEIPALDDYADELADRVAERLDDD